MYSESFKLLTDGTLCHVNGKPAGHTRRDGYVVITSKGKKHLAHRIVFALTHGYLPKQVDHIDGNPSNNHPDNLRAADNSLNQQNLKRARAHNELGLLGVSVRRRDGRIRYRAKIVVNGKAIELGEFKTPEQASTAYENAKVRYHVQG